MMAGPFPVVYIKSLSINDGLRLFGTIPTKGGTIAIQGGKAIGYCFLAKLPPANGI